MVSTLSITSGKKVPKMGIRHFQAILFFFYLVVTWLTRSTMSIAVVAMTTKNNSNVVTYDWHNTNIILNSFYWTYIILQAFSGYIFKTFGLKRILLVTMFLNSIVFALIPFGASIFGSSGVIGMRMLQGILQGFTYPACHTILGLWAPRKERSKLGLLVYSGGNTGTMLAMLITGYVSSTRYGWPLVFYIFGGCGVSWCVFWYLFGFESPAKHPRITEAERTYIQSSLGHGDDKGRITSIPIRPILTCLPVWALIIGNVGNSWGGTITDLEIPTFLSEALGLDLNSNGLVSASPQITQLVLCILFAPISDYIVNKKIVSLINCRRIFQFFGSILPSLVLIWFAFLRKDQISLAVFLLNFILGLNALCLYGCAVNHIDLSPKYAGALLGLENTTSMGIGLTGPLLVQYVVTDLSNIRLWRYIFLLISGVKIATSTIFIIFGSAEIQWWNSWKGKADENVEDPLTKIDTNSKKRPSSTF